MRIIRYQNPAGKVFYGAEKSLGGTFRLEGDIFSEYHMTNERAQIAKLLAPVAPAAILCIGLNYKRHAAESKLPEPQYPVLFVKGEIPNPNGLRIRTILNGETVQDWNTNDMIFDVPSLIEFLSGSTTLLPGTVILTGTPLGVGMANKPPRWLKPGDSVTIEIENIGTLTNPVALETP